MTSETAADGTAIRRITHPEAMSTVVVENRRWAEQHASFDGADRFRPTDCPRRDGPAVVAHVVGRTKRRRGPSSGRCAAPPARKPPLVSCAPRPAGCPAPACSPIRCRRSDPPSL